MDAYWPTDSLRFLWIAGLLLASPLCGLGIARMGSRGLAWLQLILLTLLVERLAASEPAGFRMIVLCLAMWLSFKVIVAVEAQKAGEPLPAVLPWLAFATLWIGMRPAVFAARPRPRPDAVAYVGRGSCWFAVGLAGFFLAEAVSFHDDSQSSTVRLLLTTAIALPSLSLMLHFGMLNIVAGIWRAVGYDCRSVCHAPLRSQSLTEFWGSRWNRAFTELSTVTIYRPLLAWVGKPMATMAAFLFSGLLHEMAISVPVRAGYGLPTLYFLLHGILVLVERSWPVRGWFGRAWTLAWLVVPLPLLFHPWFLAGTVWPMLGVSPG